MHTNAFSTSTYRHEIIFKLQNPHIKLPNREHFLENAKFSSMKHVLRNACPGRDIEIKRCHQRAHFHQRGRMCAKPNVSTCLKLINIITKAFQECHAYRVLRPFFFLYIAANHFYCSSLVYLAPTPSARAFYGLVVCMRLARKQVPKKKVRSDYILYRTNRCYYVPFPCLMLPKNDPFFFRACVFFLTFSKLAGRTEPRVTRTNVIAVTQS